LLQALIPQLANTGTSLAMPSLRIDNIDTDFVELINHLKKSGITLAPEAGTQRLRDIINKNLSEIEILDAIRYSYEAGAKLIKLYFMVGLPFETDEDVDGIVDLVEKIISITGKRMRINVSISPFVPKPMTPFQWCGMGTEEEVLSKALKIKHSLIKYKFIKINYHRVELSFLEAVLCRGGETTGFVIEQAYKSGAKFDSWREYFDYDVWKQSAEVVGYDWYKPIRGYELDEELPWDNVKVGVSKDFLKREYKKAEQGILTEDCRVGTCSICGACTQHTPTLFKASHNSPLFKGGQGGFKTTITSTTKQVQTALMPSQLSNQLYRIFFSKTNDLKFLSHLDFLRLVHRLLMLSGLPIVFTQGFNPHPKTAFCPPLSSGIEGENEFFDIWLSGFCDAGFVLDSLSCVRVKDLDFHRAIVLYTDNKYLPNYVPVGDFDVESVVVEFPCNTGYEAMLRSFLQSDDTKIIKVKKDKEKVVDLKDIVLNIELKDDKLFVLKKIQGASIFDVLLKIFETKRAAAGYFKILRIEMFCGK
jgi:radical SAM-linked protein